MYRERPSRTVSGVLWRGSATSSVDMQQRVLPDGCMDLLWLDGVLSVAGPDTTAYVTRWPLGAWFGGVRFSPGTAPTLLGMAAHELRDRVVPLADLLPESRVRRLTERVATATRAEEALEEIAIDWAARSHPVEPRIRGIVYHAQAGTPVATIATEVGLGERRLHRWCHTAFGYGPKTLGRILRMNRALDMARNGTPLATVAAAKGYADQSHLARDVRALAGVPPGVLIS